MEILAEDLIQSLQNQRNDALDAVANLTAQLMQKEREAEELKRHLAARSHAKENRQEATL